MDDIAAYREKIDAFDEELISLFAKRADLVKKIGESKERENLTVIDKKRENEKIETMLQKAAKYNLDKDFVKTVWYALFKLSYRLEGNQ